MKVLHVYSGNLYGGVETLLRTLADCAPLSPRMTPEFALCFEGRLSGELASTGFPVHDLGAVRVSRPLSVRRARQRLVRLLQDRHFDLAVCHSLWPLAIFGPVVRRARCPLVLWIHDAVTGRHWIDRWARRIVPDLILCNSRFTQDTLRNVYPSTKAAVVYYPVSAPRRQDSENDRATVRFEEGAPPDCTVIIQVSRMEAWKGHALHLDALGLLRHLPDWVCWQVGGAQRPAERHYFRDLEARAQMLGIADRVRFLGERPDVPKLLGAADIFCQPNLGPEPFGISFAEAMWSRLPVVTTDMGGARELVDSSCGFVVAPNPDAVAAALRHLIESPASRARLGSNGFEKVQRLCGPEKQMGKLSDVLHACLEEALAA